MSRPVDGWVGGWVGTDIAMDSIHVLCILESEDTNGVFMVEMM